MKKKEKKVNNETANWISDLRINVGQSFCGLLLNYHQVICRVFVGKIIDFCTILRSPWKSLYVFSHEKLTSLTLTPIVYSWQAIFVKTWIFSFIAVRIAFYVFMNDDRFHRLTVCEINAVMYMSGIESNSFLSRTRPANFSNCWNLIWNFPF